MTIDAGNSTIKIGIFDNEILEHIIVNKNFDEKEIINIFEQHKIKNSLLCFSRTIEDELLDSLKIKIGLRILDHTTSLPIQNLYQSPKSLGKDRLAASIGGHYSYRHTNNVIVDFGTALTINLINSKGQFLGGNISCGLEMRFKALHQFTGRLPLIKPQETVNLYGTNTELAISDGAINGILAEMEYYYKYFGQIFDDIKFILTGGSSTYISNYLTIPFVLMPNLVLEGLNQILIFNEK